MKILCRTLFDCTRTGVTGSFKPSILPFQDKAGHWIRNVSDWQHSRNQQRNFETLVQVLGLKTQVFDLTDPVCQNHTWQFDWQVESDAVYGSSHSPDPLSGLCQDIDAIPMMLGLGEKVSLPAYVVTSGPQANLWFEIINI